jgi:hypothetical protein
MGNSVKDNQTIENIECIFNTAKQNGFEGFIFPHYYYPTDCAWKVAGTLEQMMLEFSFLSVVLSFAKQRQEAAI